MSNRISKKLASIFMLILMSTLIFTGCAGKATTDTGQADKSYYIGVNTWGAGVPMIDTFGDNAVYATKLYGNTTTRASDDFTLDKETTNIQNFCSAGVDGICMQPAGVTNLLMMGDVCMNAKVPFVLYTFIGAEADRETLIETNPYYVGCAEADKIADGRNAAVIAIEDGCKTAVIIGGNIGDNQMDQSKQGFTEYFEANGGTVLSEARCTDASECATKAEDMLSAYNNADCIYAMVGDYVPGSLSAIDKLGLDGSIKVYMSCVDKTSGAYIKDGTVTGGTDGIVLGALLAPSLLQNYLDGHPILDDTGKPPHLQTQGFRVDQSNIDAYMAIFNTEDVKPITNDMLKSLCWRYNPDVTYQTYVDILNSGLTLNALVKAHGMDPVD